MSEPRWYVFNQLLKEFGLIPTLVASLILLAIAIGYKTGPLAYVTGSAGIVGLAVVREVLQRPAYYRRKLREWWGAGIRSRAGGNEMRDPHEARAAELMQRIHDRLSKVLSLEFQSDIQSFSIELTTKVWLGALALTFAKAVLVVSQQAREDANRLCDAALRDFGTQVRKVVADTQRGGGLRL